MSVPKDQPYIKLGPKGYEGPGDGTFWLGLGLGAGLFCFGVSTWKEIHLSKPENAVTSAKAEALLIENAHKKAMNKLEEDKVRRENELRDIESRLRSKCEGNGYE